MSSQNSDYWIVDEWYRNMKTCKGADNNGHVGRSREKPSSFCRGRWTHIYTPARKANTASAMAPSQRWCYLRPEADMYAPTNGMKRARVLRLAR